MDRAPGRGARGRAGRRRVGPGASRRRRRRAGLPAPGHRGHVPHQRPEPRRSRRRSCATACATSSSAARASTSAARSRTRWRTCGCCARTTTWRPSSGSSTCPRGGIGERTIAVAARARRSARRRRLGGHRGGRRRRRATSRPGRGRRSAASRAVIARLRTPCRRAGAAGAARRGARGVGLSGDAHGRLAGRRGPLGQPARAARGRRRATATSSQTMRSTGCSRRLRSSPTRTPTRPTPTRPRSSRSTPPRASSSTSSSSAASRRASSRTRAPWTTRARWRRSGASRTSGLTRARHRLYLTHAAQRATWGRGGFSVPCRFLLEIPDRADARPAPRGSATSRRRPAPRRRALGGYDLSAVRPRRRWRPARGATPVGEGTPRTAPAAAGRRVRGAAGCATDGRDVPSLARPGREA